MAVLSNAMPGSLIQAGIAYIIPTLLFCQLGVFIHRRYFSPLSKIPGPFLASFSDIYYFYYQFIKDGTLYLQYERLREQYGPVVRISPNEVLVMDPENYDKIYTMNSKFYKDPDFYGKIGTESSLVTTITNEAHRRHRAILAPFFLRRSVLEQEDIIQEKAAKLCRRIGEDGKRGTPNDLQAGFRAVSLDVVTEYAFGKENCWNSLDADEYANWYHDSLRGMLPMTYFFRFFPALEKPMKGMPYWLAKRMNPIIIPLMDCLKVAEDEVVVILKEIKAGIQPKRETIYHTICNPPDGDRKQNLPTEQHLVDEAIGLTAAATETVGNAMDTVAWAALHDPQIYARLHNELKDAFPNPEHMPFNELEKLPYLSAMIKEALRRGHAGVGTFPRVVPQGGATFNGYYCPEGTIVGMSHYLMHRDPEAFPDPDKFDPERWLKADGLRLREKRLVAFSRGNRQCLGQPLATCEMYVTLGQVFRRFDDLRAFDVGPEDMVHRDFFSAYHPKNARKFRVVRASH